MMYKSNTGVCLFMKKELFISVFLGIIGIIIITVILLKPPTYSPLTKQSITTQSATISPSELARHNTEKDCWMSVENRVYDVTQYIPNHPGGPATIIPFCGGDGTQAFNDKNGRGPHSNQATQLLQTMFKGTL